MADSKLSELTAATSVAASDIFYTVKAGEDRKVTAATIFSDVATPVSFSGKISVVGSTTIVSPGSLPTTSNICLITNPNASGNLNIGSGTNGQILTVIMTSNSGGYTLLLVDSQLGHNQIEFSSSGDTAQLIYTNDRWYCIGGTAAVS